MHTMRVQTKYYNLLKCGLKTIELRLYDEKRQQIKEGDEIVFSDLSNSADTFKAFVCALHRAECFSDLCDVISPQQAGFNTKDELISVMEQFYSIEAQKQQGVLAIEIQKIS